MLIKVSAAVSEGKRADADLAAVICRFFFKMSRLKFAIIKTGLSHYQSHRHGHNLFMHASRVLAAIEHHANGRRVRIIFEKLPQAAQIRGLNFNIEQVKTGIITEIVKATAKPWLND